MTIESNITSHVTSISNPIDTRYSVH